MEKGKKYTIWIFAILVVFIVIGIVNQNKRNQELKNGIVVIATVKSTDGGRGSIDVHVQYEYDGKIKYGVFGIDTADSLKTNGKVRLLISKDPLGKYVKYIGVVK
jgi:hypothetical protein